MSNWNIEETAALAEQAEESTLAELGAFGSCQGWFFGSAEAPIVFETGFEVWEDENDEGFDWEAWNAATEDVPGLLTLNMSL